MAAAARSRNSAREVPHESVGMKRVFEMLLPLQPFTGLLSTVTVRFQAHHNRLDNDRNFPMGVWREVWGGNSSPKRRQRALGSGGSMTWLLGGGLFYNPATVYILAHQTLEDKLGQALASMGGRRFLIRATGYDRGAFKRVQRAFEEGNVWSRPGLYAGYLAAKAVVYAGVCSVSHPFSILRTVVLMRGDVPLLEAPFSGGFLANLRYASPFDSSGLYWSSLGAHIVSTVAETTLSDITVRTLRHTFSAYLDHQYQASGGDRRRRSVALPGTHVDRLRARLNYAAAVSTIKAVSSFAVNILLLPLLTIRLRLEAQGGADYDPLTGPLPHAGLLACARAIWHTEGTAGFYRGLGVHVLIFAGNMLWISLIYGLTEAYIQLDIDEEDD